MDEAPPLARPQAAPHEGLGGAWATEGGTQHAGPTLVGHLLHGCVCPGALCFSGSLTDSSLVPFDIRTSISCAGPEAEASSQRKVFGLRCSLAGRPTTHSMSCLLPPFPGEGKAPQFPDPHSPRSAPSEADFTLPYGRSSSLCRTQCFHFIESLSVVHRSEMVDEIPRQLPLEDLHLSCYAVHQSGQKMPQPEPEPLTKETHRTSLKFSWSLEYRQATPQIFLQKRMRAFTNQIVMELIMTGLDSWRAGHDWTQRGAHTPPGQLNCRVEPFNSHLQVLESEMFDADCEEAKGVQLRKGLAARWSAWGWGRKFRALGLLEGAILNRNRS
ncbi:hypothetical protein H920_00313 [Fukomys damarensis]|uniref:Uncharacterized protein n=1 Tax=Fukomys damarensis TaxID=885580 RepID=A0A091E1Q0_FUKDA|nr:hypothetical protein H920_00313 [Fukomys damarensis]